MNKIEFFSILKRDLTGAPVEVKESFNKIVKYYAVFEEEWRIIKSGASDLGITDLINQIKIISAKIKGDPVEAYKIKSDNLKSKMDARKFAHTFMAAFFGDKYDPDKTDDVFEALYEKNDRDINKTIAALKNTPK